MQLQMQPLNKAKADGTTAVANVTPVAKEDS